MFKGFQNISKNKEFNEFPSLIFQMNNEAYGFSGCTFWLDAAHGLNTQTDLNPVTLWREKINGINFIQETVADQPRLILSDGNFNNNPVIDFNADGKGLFATNSLQSRNQTLVLVYQYISSPNLSSYQARLISDGDESNARTSGKSFSWRLSSNSTVTNTCGFCSGTSALCTSNNEYVTTTRISIINLNYWYSNGASVTISNGGFSSISDFNILAIGSINPAFSGIFKIAEIIQYKSNFNETQILALSNILNTKYAVY